MEMEYVVWSHVYGCIMMTANKFISRIICLKLCCKNSSVIKNLQKKKSVHHVGWNFKHQQI